jgi:hypothetical protein
MGRCARIARKINPGCFILAIFLIFKGEYVICAGSAKSARENNIARTVSKINPGNFIILKLEMLKEKYASLAGISSGAPKDKKDRVPPILHRRP